MRITILTDDASSWFVFYGKKLEKALQDRNHEVEYIFNKSQIKVSDICFLLSCSNIVEKKYLDLNKKNIVIHASDLPNGKGFSPLQWQILEGKNDIPLTLFEAVEGVDSGPYYLKDFIQCNGGELYNELRELLGRKIIEMSLKFVNEFENLKPIEQNGIETFFLRRRKKDDQIDPQKSIIELFNHFRIADNEKFPLFFELNGQTYNIKIEKV
jgi:methionyl-tRNA formyltransferase